MLALRANYILLLALWASKDLKTLKLSRSYGDIGNNKHGTACRMETIVDASKGPTYMIYQTQIHLYHIILIFGCVIPWAERVGWRSERGAKPIFETTMTKFEGMIKNRIIDLYINS